jgi:hypothetical protein
MSDATRILPPQTQDRQPGREGKMHPAPDYMPRFPEYAIARTGIGNKSPQDCVVIKTL